MILLPYLFFQPPIGRTQQNLHTLVNNITGLAAKYNENTPVLADWRGGVQNGVIIGSPEKQGVFHCQVCFCSKNNDHSKGNIVFQRSLSAKTDSGSGVLTSSEGVKWDSVCLYK